jgi:hypothetical protein
MLTREINKNQSATRNEKNQLKEKYLVILPHPVHVKNYLCWRRIEILVLVRLTPLKFA